MKISAHIFFKLSITISSISMLWAKYNYSEEGTNWAGLCANGKGQSPIEINSQNLVRESNGIFHLDFMETKLQTDLENKGYTLKVHGIFAHLSATDINGVLASYSSHQLHFHAPSEHKI